MLLSAAIVKARLCRARPPCPPALRRPAAGHLPPPKGGKPPPAGGRGRQWPAAGQAFAAGGFGGAGRAATQRTPPTPSLLQSFNGRTFGRPNGRQLQKKNYSISFNLINFITFAALDNPRSTNITISWVLLKSNSLWQD